MSSNPKSVDRGDQLFGAFVRTNEPPKPAPSPPSGGGKEPDPAPDPGPSMWCSECRAPMRDRYFALNERPICAKCRPAFAKRIERGATAAAFQRAALQGALVAVACALAFGAAVTVFPFFRIFFVVGIGYLVGKRVMAAVDGYGGRRYQYLAVGLTYFSIGLGSLAPAFQESREAEQRRRAIRADTSRTLATQGRALQEELKELGLEESGDPTDAASGETSGEEPVAAEKPRAPAKRTAGAPSAPGIGTVFILLVTLPVLGMFTYGLKATAIGLMALGYGLYQAWRRTDGQGLDLQLSGPFRVGAGPIPPAM